MGTWPHVPSVRLDDQGRFGAQTCGKNPEVRFDSDFRNFENRFAMANRMKSQFWMVNHHHFDRYHIDIKYIILNIFKSSRQMGSLMGHSPVWGTSESSWTSYCLAVKNAGTGSHGIVLHHTQIGEIPIFWVRSSCFVTTWFVVYWMLRTMHTWPPLRYQPRKKSFPAGYVMISPHLDEIEAASPVTP